MFDLFMNFGLVLIAVNVWMIIGYLIIAAPPSNMEPDNVFDGFIQSFFWPWMAIVKLHAALDRWINKL